MNVALCPEHLDILSICTGGGGLDLGFELAIPSARTVCMVEREAFAVAQLVSAMEAGLMAPAAIWSDARTFNGRRWRGCVDGLIGGIPCQPHSLAGRKRGSLDARDLWSEARRIIVQSRAWFVLIENVGGMLSAGDDEIAGAERVHRDLHKLGFTVEAGLFTAAEVGAPHQRERVFILAVADHDQQLPKYAEPWQRTQDEAEDGWRVDAGGRGAGLYSGVGLADAYRQRPQGQRPNIASAGREDARRSTRLCNGTDLVRAECAERGKDAGGGYQPDRNDRRRHQEASRAGEPSQSMVNADIVELRREPPAGEQPELQHQHGFGTGYLFPPGPGDFSRWAATLEGSPELEPAFRRVADGLATRLDIGRVDRLRMLGNGVVPLQAAYAIRTLATRLAGRGSAGAARLVRMMGV